MTSLCSPSNSNIKNGNYSLRHRRICELCCALNPNSVFVLCGKWVKEIVTIHLDIVEYVNCVLP